MFAETVSGRGNILSPALDLPAPGVYKTLRLKGSNHDQDYCRDQNQYWEFIEPAEKNVAAAVAVMLEILHQLAAPNVITN